MSHIFSGDPSDSNQWSEISANRPPGKRSILNALGGFNIGGQDSGNALVAFSFAQAPGNDHIDQVKTLRDSMIHFTTLIVEGFVGIVCTTPFPVVVEEPLQKKLEALQIFPNPTTNTIAVKDEEKQIRRIAMFDGFGKMALQSNAIDPFVSVEYLAPGLYLVKAEMKDGSIRMGKVVIMR